MKSGRALGRTDLPAILITLEGEATIKLMGNVLNKCFSTGQIPDSRQNAKVLLPEKEYRLKTNNYSSITSRL